MGLNTLKQSSVKNAFQAGGKEFHYIACLNESDAWIQALADIAANHLRGWWTRRQSIAVAASDER